MAYSARYAWEVVKTITGFTVDAAGWAILVAGGALMVFGAAVLFDMILIYSLGGL